MALRPTHPRGAHAEVAPGRGAPQGETVPPRDRPCYEFNPGLPRASDDRGCVHCRHYLTARCPHLEEFLEDLYEPDPE